MFFLPRLASRPLRPTEQCPCPQYQPVRASVGACNLQRHICPSEETYGWICGAPDARGHQMWGKLCPPRPRRQAGKAVRRAHPRKTPGTLPFSWRCWEAGGRCTHSFSSDTESGGCVLFSPLGGLSLWCTFVRRFINVSQVRSHS